MWGGGGNGEGGGGVEGVLQGWGCIVRELCL